MPSSQPPPLSLELSVRIAVPIRRKDLLFGRRVLSYHGKACLCTGDIFPRIPGDYKTAPRTQHSLSRPRTQISVQPPSGLRAPSDAGATTRAKPTSSSLAALRGAKNLPGPPQKLGSPHHLRDLQLRGSSPESSR